MVFEKLILIMFIFLIPLVSSDYSDCSIYGNCKPIVSTTINNNTITVNASGTCNLWDSLDTPNDITLINNNMLNVSGVLYVNGTGRKIDVYGNSVFNKNLSVQEKFAVGTTPSSSYPAYFYALGNSSAGTQSVVYNLFSVRQSNESSTAYYYAVRNNVQLEPVCTNNVSIAMGLENVVSHYGTGKLTDARGMQNTVSLLRTGNIVTAYGSINTVQVYGGTAYGNITTAIAGYYSNKNQGNGTKVTTSTGIEIADIIVNAGNNVTNDYGLKIGSIDSGDTLNYAIYTQGGKVSFGDNVEVRSGSNLTVQEKIKLKNGGMIWDNSTCTFISSPDGSTVSEICNA